MRTTLTIDDDILAVAKAMSERQGRTIGDIVSELARAALQQPATSGERNGIPLLPISQPRVRVTLAQVNALRDEAP